MTMLILVGLCATAFVVALILTPIGRGLALRHALVDSPDSHRKMHSMAVARIGGAPILAAYIVSMLVLAIWPGSSASVFRAGWPLVRALAPATFIIFLVGITDDLVELRPREKLTGQLLAIAVLCLSGITITHLGGFVLPVWATYPLTFGWLVVCSNAFNLIDGLDGLASGAGLIAAAAIGVVGCLKGDAGMQLAVAPLIGATLGFLFYNRPPASVFLGDCGSLTLGFVLGCLAIVWANHETTLFQASSPLVALALPLLDTSLAIARRFVRGVPIFAADRRHIHHRLLDRGIAAPRVVTLLFGVAGAAATLSIMQSTLAWPIVTPVILLTIGIAIWLGIRALDYAEFSWIVQAAHLRTMQRLVNGQYHLALLENDLNTADNVEECWRVICEASRLFGFYNVSLHAGGRVFTDAERMSKTAGWVITIHLHNDEFLCLEQSTDSIAHPRIVAALAELFRSSVSRLHVPQHTMKSPAIQELPLAVPAPAPALRRMVAGG